MSHRFCLHFTSCSFLNRLVVILISFLCLTSLYTAICIGFGPAHAFTIDLFERLAYNGLIMHFFASQRIQLKFSPSFFGSDCLVTCMFLLHSRSLLFNEGGAKYDSHTKPCPRGSSMRNQMSWQKTRDDCTTVDPAGEDIHYLPSPRSVYLRDTAQGREYLHKSPQYALIRRERAQRVAAGNRRASAVARRVRPSRNPGPMTTRPQAGWMLCRCYTQTLPLNAKSA